MASTQENIESLENQHKYVKKTTQDDVYKIPEDQWKAFQEAQGGDFTREEFFELVSIFKRLTPEQFAQMIQTKELPPIKLTDRELELLRAGWWYGAKWGPGNGVWWDADGFHIHL